MLGARRGGGHSKAALRRPLRAPAPSDTAVGDGLELGLAALPGGGVLPSCQGAERAGAGGAVDAAHYLGGGLVLGLELALGDDHPQGHRSCEEDEYGKACDVDHVASFIVLPQL